MKTGGIFEFGEFQINALARVLRREGEVLALNHGPLMYSFTWSRIPEGFLPEMNC